VIRRKSTINFGDNKIDSAYPQDAGTTWGHNAAGKIASSESSPNLKIGALAWGGRKKLTRQGRIVFAEKKVEGWIR